MITYRRLRKWLNVEVFAHLNIFFFQNHSHFWCCLNRNFTAAYKVFHFCWFWLFTEVLCFCVHFADRKIHFLREPFLEVPSFPGSFFGKYEESYSESKIASSFGHTSLDSISFDFLSQLQSLLLFPSSEEKAKKSTLISSFVNPLRRWKATKNNIKH